MNIPAMPSKNGSFELAEKAERSMRRSVRKVYEERARQNETVSIWRDGKVVILPAAQLLKELDEQSKLP